MSSGLSMGAHPTVPYTKLREGGSKMELVVKWSEIVENLRTLARYRQSKVPAEAKFYKDHILRGICFVV
jgi:hypothetical protein